MNKKFSFLLSSLSLGTITLLTTATLISCGKKEVIDKEVITEKEDKETKEDEKINEDKEKDNKNNQENNLAKLNNKSKKFGAKLNLSNVVLDTDWSTINLDNIKQNHPMHNYHWSETMYNHVQKNTKYSKNEETNISSSLATKIVDNSQYKLDFIPYADIGIVEDSIEYLLKEKSLPAAHRDRAEKSLKERAQKDGLSPEHAIIKYNDLAHFKKQGIAKKFNIGFMQNEHDNSELSYAWNAVPKNDINKSGEWFQKQRWEKWIDGGINAQDLTITFGPFANSYWHTAYQNNYSEIDLARSLKEMSENYGTKSFDFYFAPPYNTKTGDYASSTALLAGALKILIEQDKEFKVRLSLVVGSDGFTIAGNTPNFKLVGDDMAPLWVFTKYLGINFNLNLVTNYFNPRDNILSQDRTKLVDEDWEIKGIKKSFYQSKLTWTNLINHFNKDNEIEERLVTNRISITTWPGIRSEKAVWDFTAEDALELRKFAEQEGIHSLSTFYISRDNPSVFMKNNVNTVDQWADQNPINQHLRSSKGYESLTYSKILNGSQQYAPEIKNSKEDIYNLQGAFNYKKWVNQNNDLNDLYSKVGDNHIIDEYDKITTNNNLEKEGKHLTWASANPNRTENITEEVAHNGQTNYSPYVDVGLLWSSFNQQTENQELFKKLDRLTLAFVQQNNSHDDHLDLTFAGVYRPNRHSGDDNTYFIDNQFIPKVLDNIKNFENLTISYGGFATGDNNKNPWHTAYDLAKKQLPNGKHNEIKAKAASLLQPALLSFNQEIQELKQNNGMPLHIDFDIEGHARSQKPQIEVLAKTLANMKKTNKNWKFSLTLPVMPSGIIDSEVEIMEIFAQEFKEANISRNELPTLNIMAMDYGRGIYSQANNGGKTNFDLAKDATTNTALKYQNVINKYFKEENIEIQEVYKLMGVTPMIGVNDHTNGVFTLEDAKQFYNWVHKETQLSYISIWSLNCDSPVPDKQLQSPKTLQSHGLNYLYKFDFSKVFLGNWKSYKHETKEWSIEQNENVVVKTTLYILNPRRNPFGIKETNILLNK